VNVYDLIVTTSKTEMRGLYVI